MSGRVIRFECLAAHARMLAGEITPAEYQALDVPSARVVAIGDQRYDRETVDKLTTATRRGTP